jgi:CRP/FNR family cyclic AMP-dependent transcriptional regulator
MTALVQVYTREQIIDDFLHYCHIKTYPPKTTIIHTGETNNKLYYIIEGSVSVTTEEEDDGRELIYAYLNKGQFIGEVGVFNETEVTSVNIKTRCVCKLAEISHARLMQVLRHELPHHAVDILFLIGTQLATRLLMTSRNFRDLAFMDTEGRIARTLLDLCREPDAKPHPRGTEIRITRQELSHLVGCSREVAGRVLKELENKKLIATQGKTIVVFKEE